MVNLLAFEQSAPGDFALYWSGESVGLKVLLQRIFGPSFF